MDKDLDENKNKEKDYDFQFPTDEEIDAAYSQFQEYERLIEDIMYYKDVSEYEARNIYIKMKLYKDHGYLWDWTQSEINYAPRSDYYYSKYRQVYRLSDILSDKDMVLYAKNGVLGFRLDELKNKHPLTAGLYIRINSLVREAYYAYLKHISRIELEFDREKLLDTYDTMIGALKFWARDESASKRKEYSVSFNDYANKCIDNIGVIVETDKNFHEYYSTVSFDNYYYAAHRIILDFDSQQLLIEAINFLEIEKERIKDMYIEDYRGYKLDLMRLDEEELEEYRTSTERYDKTYKKVISKIK